MKKQIKLFSVIALLFCAITAKAQTDSTFYIKGAIGRLAAHLQLPDLKKGEKCPVVIICHGFTGNQNEPLLRAIADNLVNAGIGALRFDFNAHGQSEGDFVNMTVPNEIEDALSIIAFAHSLPQTSSISLLGHSQGGVVSAMTAGQLGNEIQSVVLMAPAAVLRDDALRGNTMGAMYDPWHAPEYVTMPSGHKLGRNFIQTAITLPIYETAQKYEGPALIIHGMDDRVVPYTYGERFHQVMKNSEIILIPGENHGFGTNLPYAASMASEWLVKNLKAQ
ncbi:alpha/beta fold hydrolase [Bacteroides sp. An322]|uniref:alpha/beta hydrolase family protein n=1 Tax=Bacteroidaceae TaxID=815 RepID=UPI000B37CBCC|nr:alpha/beta fold hydrolase [Bacteroides sp. An322]OUO22659.1 alpha/beta hydrolase [Bacteroides sp. An322]